MAQIKSHTPKLRFKEFSWEWEKNRLEEIWKIIWWWTPETSNPDFWWWNIQWFTPTELKEKYILNSKRTISDLGLKKSSAKLLPKNTLLLSSRATIWDINIALNECSTNQWFQSIIVDENNSNEFVYYIIKNNKKELIKKASWSTFLEISKNEMSKLSFFFPTFLEQQKIASFLSSIDEKIENIKERKKNLEAYKKWVMKKIFSQELRFKYKNWKKFGEWEEKKLGEVAIFLKWKWLSKSDITEDWINKCVRYWELYTDYNEKIEKIKSRTNMDLWISVLSKINDVLIPASWETQIDIATTSCILEEGVILWWDLNIIRWSGNWIFLSYYLNSFKKKDIAKLAQWNSVVHLYSSQLQHLKIKLPSLPEQQKISDFLSSIDENLEKVNEQLKKIKEFKKGLLQGMFV